MELRSKLLEGKVCLVTGCSRGIGKEIATQFALNGAIVYANCRKNGVLDEFVKEIEKKYNAKIIPLYFDVTDSVEAKKAIMRIKNERNRIDVLVNNAGIMKDALIGMISPKVINDIFSVNVVAVIEMLQLVVKLMYKQRSGSIINISSIVGTNGNKGQLVYSASKGAVISITKTAAKELASKNIRVNAIAPGMIDTDMYQSVGSIHKTEHAANIGMGRLGTTEDVAKTCIYLASDLSEYVTGQIIGVDGSTLI
jgi:3-oxoacyl-[acyl-carrier protein] reductase